MHVCFVLSKCAEFRALQLCSRFQDFNAIILTLATALLLYHSYVLVSQSRKRDENNLRLFVAFINLLFAFRSMDSAYNFTVAP